MLARTVADATESVLARVVAPTWWIAPCTESVSERRVLPPTERVLSRIVGMNTDNVLDRHVAAPTEREDARTVADATDSVLARVVVPT